MSVQQVFVISRAGSLIYEWSTPETTMPNIERIFDWPLGLQLENVDGKPVVVWGSGVPPRYFVSAVNGIAVNGTSFTKEDQRISVFDFVAEQSNYPVKLGFSMPMVSTNEKIILSSTFHSLYTIAVQLSPAPGSSGIEVLETTQFRLHCLQSRTGVKFVVVTSSGGNPQAHQFLAKLYELYADYALKNPFYSIDMPIRCHKFDDGLRALLDRIGKFSAVTV
ncbi:unnamed protein product, partial [Mesorhabditis spiculigera]